MSAADYDRGYEDGKRAGVVAGRKESADTMRKMMKIIMQDKDADVARCATLLLEGFNQELAGRL